MLSVRTLAVALLMILLLASVDWTCRPATTALDPALSDLPPLGHATLETEAKSQPTLPASRPASPSGGKGGCPATPGDSSLEFPCRSRIRGHNSLSFFQWSAADEKRKAALLAPYVAECASRRRNGTTAVVSSAYGQAVGCAGLSGQWNRCWVVDMGAGAVPTCVGGSSFDIQMESADAKIAVDRVMDQDDGTYEVIFFVRKRGTYSFCVDAVGSHDKCIGKVNFRLSEKGSAANYNFSVVGRVIGDYPPVAEKWQDVPRTPLPPQNVRCTDAAFTGGVDSVPLAASCRHSADRDRFRFGGWYRMPNATACDGVHCTGTPLPSMEGWIWAPDICVLHIYTSDELHVLLNRLWVVGWGGSTMKQPMSNLIEYYLGQPIFKFFMRNLDQWKSRKKAGFFSYRQWSTFVTNKRLGTSSLWNMLWGGCPGLMAAPSHCTTTVGMRYFPRLDTVIGGRFPHNMSYPNAILLDHVVWRWPLLDEAEFSGQTGVMFAKIRAAAAFGRAEAEAHYRRTGRGLLGPNGTHRTRSVQRKPLLIWHTGTVPANNNVTPRADHCGHHAFHSHLSWTIEDDYDTNRTTFQDDTLLISRDQVTLPLHFGTTFVHFGVHYGASEGMCNTGHARSEKYQFSQCVRKTWGDDAVILMWFNAIAQHEAALGNLRASRNSPEAEN